MGFVHDRVIHAFKCSIVMPPGSTGQCDACKHFRPNLRARAHHVRQMQTKDTDKTSASSTLPISKLSDIEKDARLKSLSKTVRILRGKAKFKLWNKFENESLCVDEAQHNFLSNFATEQKKM